MVALFDMRRTVPCARASLWRRPRDRPGHRAGRRRRRRGGPRTARRSAGPTCCSSSRSDAYAADAARAGPLAFDEAAPRALAGAVAVLGVIGAGRELERGPRRVGARRRGPRRATVEVFHSLADLGGVPDGRRRRADRAARRPVHLPDRRADRRGSGPARALVGGLAGGGGAGPGAAVPRRRRAARRRGRRRAAGVACAAARVAGLPADRPGAGGHRRRRQRACSSSPACRPSTSSRRCSATCRRPTRRWRANGLMSGLVIDENRPEYGVGDYLVRVLLGARPGARRRSWSATCRASARRSACTCATRLSADGRARPRAAAPRRPAAARCCSRATAAAAACSRSPDHDAGLVDDAARRARRGHVLPGRDRAGRRAQPPARLHRDDRAAQLKRPEVGARALRGPPARCSSSPTAPSNLDLILPSAPTTNTHGSDGSAHCCTHGFGPELGSLSR